MESTTSASCPSCKLPVLAEFYFCPNCGRQLRSKPIIVSVVKQIGLYFFSFFLSPLGLYFAFKYIKQPLGKTKMVGWIILILTILSVCILIYLTANAFQQYVQLLNSLGSQQY